MNFLGRFFVENYKFTFVMTAFVIFYGLSGLMKVKSESFPSVNIGSVVITTRYDGATAEDIETKITRPIETEIQRVSGLKRVKSTSQAGVSTIVTEVDIDQYDVEKVIADLQRAVDRASGLPPDLLSKPIFSEIKSDEFPVIEVAVIGSNENRARDQVADLLQEEIKDNKKVSSVSLSGFRERQFNILLSRSLLTQQHVSISEVQNALTLRNITVPGGEIKNETSQKLVRIEGKARTREELESIVVRSNFSGQRILLKDVARIEDASEEPLTISNYNGQEATLITITKKGGADIIDLANEVSETLKEFEAKYQDRLDFIIFSDEGVRVGDRLGVLVSNGWQGIVLVIFFLMVFLPGKIGLVTALSLPLALAATVGVIASMGYTLNTITIIALVIAIGMLVDNAVVVSENFTRLRDEGLGINESLYKTIQELWAPITATALTTIAAFLPMLITTGIMGQFIKAIPIVVSIALMLSLAESFFLLPTRLKFVGYRPQNIQSKSPDWIDRLLVPRFEKLIDWLVVHKWISLGLFFGILTSTFMMFAFVNKVNLFPSDQTEIYISRMEVEKGTRIEKTNEIVLEVAGKIKEVLGDQVLHIVSTSGQSSVDISDPKGEIGSNTALIRMYVSKKTQDEILTNDLLENLRTIKNPKVTRLSFEALANGPPVGDPISVTLRSSNFDELSSAAEHIRKAISEKPGVFDSKIDDVFGDDEIQVKINYNQVARLSLTLQDIGMSVRTAIAGQKMGDVNLNNREVDYFLRFDDKDKATIENLASIKIADRADNLIPLGNMANFETQSGAPQIKRYDFRRAKTVTANLDDSVFTSMEANKFISEEFERVKDQYKEVSIVFGGEAESTNESVNSLFNALLLSLIGIFALLVLIFRSYLSPFIILTTIPLGLVGVSVAFFLHQRDLSFMALIGIIGLSGIIVNSGIILISFIEQLRIESSLSLREILVKASGMRLRAVLVTSLTTISGLVPTAYGIGGVDYFIIPMALALAWGLSTGTLLTLLWVGPAYAIVEDLRSIFSRKPRG